MDELEREDLDFDDEHKKYKTATKKYQRAHRTEVGEANLEDDEHEDTVFIDNLPHTQG